MIANIAKAVKRKALMTSRKCVSKLLNNLTAVAEHRRSNNQLVLMAVVLRTLLTQRSRTGDSDDLPVAPAFLSVVCVCVGERARAVGRTVRWADACWRCTQSSLSLDAPFLENSAPELPNLRARPRLI